MDVDIVDVVSSVNKISVIAFIITFIFVGYQIFLLKKDFFNKKESKPVIPEFDDKNVVKKHETPLVHLSVKQTIISRPKHFIQIIFGVILLVISIIFFIISSANKKIDSERSDLLSPTPIINYVASKGIKIYNQKWSEIQEKDMMTLILGQELIIGIESIHNLDIDKARIRINQNEWKESDITMKFDKTRNVYYINHAIATGEAMLKIDAELHSKIDGWLSK
ncbi:MAG: hypothetical protein Q7R95_00505 [bacterium]|nr:hypothetical protein [bacterium]